MLSDEAVEIYDDPVFDYGTKVRATKHVRNDGTYPGMEIGEVIVRKGEVGYVASIGTFLQRFYIYGIDFVDSGRLVGMRARELMVVEE